MGVTKIKSGDIVQIPLPKGLGFAYGKYICLMDFLPNIGFADLLKVYDQKFLEPITNFHEIISDDYILPPLFIAGLQPTLRKKIWSIIGNQKLLTNDMIVPHFRRNEAWNPRDNKDEKWYYCIDADSTKKVKTTYDKVKHLSDLTADGTGIIETKIAMSFLIKEGQNVENYFDLEEYYEKVAYERVKESPLYFQLPKETRDYVMP